MWSNNVLRDDLNKSLCHTTADTQTAPIFSGAVGFDVDKFCEAKAALQGKKAGRGSTVTESCTTSCGFPDYAYQILFLGSCKAPQTSACFDDDYVVRALLFSNWTTNFIRYAMTGWMDRKHQNLS
ncbi:uncharacterized protein LOC135374002 isoform X3 [Ornithodoros turicata]|uniref:uncharacterized protein LOC135374002 isoform X3 n=1 Tax=Ornithodoros turicata TaxID=34597 RepID=UPI003139BD00